MKRDERREQRRKEKEERERNGGDDHLGQTSAERLSRISHIGATRRKHQGRIGRRQRPHSAIGARGSRHNTLRPVRSAQNLQSSCRIDSVLKVRWRVCATQTLPRHNWMPLITCSVRCGQMYQQMPLMK